MIDLVFFERENKRVQREKEKRESKKMDDDDDDNLESSDGDGGQNDLGRKENESSPRMMGDEAICTATQRETETATKPSFP